MATARDPAPADHRVPDAAIRDRAGADPELLDTPVTGQNPLNLRTAGPPATGAAGLLTFCLAGPFAVHRDGRVLDPATIGSRKARTLLKLLTVHRGQWLPADHLAEVVWPEALPRNPAQGVATLVSRLRAALGPGVVLGDRDGYTLGGASVLQVDLDRAAELVAEAGRRAAAGEPALASAAATQALALLGDAGALADEAYADWARPARTQCDALRRQTRHTAAAAALAMADPVAARDLMRAAVATDPFDEAGYRLLMRAAAETGEPAAALAAYEELRARLATEYGTDPAPETGQLHVAILRSTATGPEPPGSAAAPASRATTANGRETLAGRDAEVATLHRFWAGAAAGHPALVVISGEAGIGKTRLATELRRHAEATGGTVLAARCYEAESSLFLQPFVEALGQHAARCPPATVRAAAAGWAGPLTALVPAIAGVLGPVTEAQGTPEMARRRAYDAVCRYLYRLAGSPVLLLLDDLQNAGLSTVELLHYLARQPGQARLLVLATVRAEEGSPALAALAGVMHRVELGPLPATAVAALAAGAGHAGLAGQILRRTGGHTLFVVETLRALAAGESGVPASLQAAVHNRVRQAGEPVAELLRGAAVLGATIDPGTLAGLLDLAPAVAMQRCEQALAARLLVVSGRAYEFANDLVREVLYEAVPVPTRIAYHRRAADLLAIRPEAVAAHAAAAGDWARAARAGLFAGEQAGRRFAASDAQALLTGALAAAARVDDPEVSGRAHLARGRVRDALTDYPGALDDFRAAVGLARQAGDRRLEMMALRELAGDVPVHLGESVVAGVDLLRDGLRIAESLGDRVMEADLLGRLAVIACNRLRFTESLGYARRAVQAGRAGRDDRALALALDGLKTSYAYLGEIELLVPVLAELEPLLRRQGDLWRLQWTVQEGAFPAIAAGDWDTALDRIEAALEINRRSGYTAYEGWFVGHLGWVHRMRGDLAGAVTLGRRALRLTHTSTHAWWRATACAQLADTLLATGDRAAALELLEEGRACAAPDGAEAYLLRCLGPLAELAEPGGAVGGDVLGPADRLIREVQAPDGSAWLAGAEAYLAVARAWLRRGEPARAATVLRPLWTAADRTGWRWVAAAAGGLLEQVGEVPGGAVGAVGLD